MDEKLMVALAALLPRDESEGRWVFFKEDRDGILDVLSNIGDLEKRRQLMAKVDQLWANVTRESGTRGRMPDRDAFKTKRI